MNSETPSTLLEKFEKNMTRGLLAFLLAAVAFLAYGIDNSPEARLKAMARVNKIHHPENSGDIIAANAASTK